MNLKVREECTLRRLATMPFLDRLELASVSGIPDRSAYRIVADLELGGLVFSFPHATELLRTTKRYCLTAAGLRRLAELEGGGMNGLLRRHPVSTQWRRVLMERLDAVAAIYRVASFIGAQMGPLMIRWYRAAPLDAAVSLWDGRTIGILRQGPTSDRTGFSKRTWRLARGPIPGAVLFLMLDEVRLRHARGMPTTRSLPALLALESDAVLAHPSEPVWRLPSVAQALSLRQVLSYVQQGGAIPIERGLLRATPPQDTTLDDAGDKTPHWMLPALLRPGEKRLLGLLFDWPSIGLVDLQKITGVSRTRLTKLLSSLRRLGLVTGVSGSGNRLALTDRGLAVPARRDRASVGVQKRRWSVSPLDSDAPDSWRNIRGRRSRQLLRNMEHTAAVHTFLAALSVQARSLSWELVGLEPPFRASRYFRHGPLPAGAGGLRSIHPDAFGILRRGERVWPFFLEWERRAVRPATMAARLAPYLRYYSTPRPRDDHGVRPSLLVVFQDELPATHFLRVAGEEMALAEVSVPLWVSHESAVRKLGPLGRIWRSPGLWDAVRIPRNF